MSDDLKYKHVVRAVQETPWAILPERLATICELIAFRAQGGRLTEDEIAERVGDRASRRGPEQAGAIAVIPIYGVIVPRADLFTRISGGTSVEGFQEMFREALNDPQVSAILLDVDSPGGQTGGVAEMAQEIRQARGKKPIAAIANTLMASAAYHLASQADEIVATPSALVGSIGVFHVHQDISAMEAKAGIKTTLTSAGRFKTEGNPFEPLSEEAQQHLQELVDDAYQTFVTDVAKGRKASVADVKAGYGQGRVLPARMAVTEKLVDRVDTFDNTVARLAQRAGNSTSGGTRSLQSRGWSRVWHDLDAASSGGYEPEPYQPEADETVECPECGAMNEPDAVYCDQCGVKLEGRDDVEPEPDAEPDNDPDDDGRMELGAAENTSDSESRTLSTLEPLRLLLEHDAVREAFKPTGS